ncbi:hypothetical protein MesoLjLa_30940 [Mesorhizobium sp. L-2-11]|nr:hypothetical protein MesoLjLa_30940 [Mesorhizobium sp. L-2-11]
MHSVAPPSVLPDISPSRGEIGSFYAGASLATLMISESSNEGLISPLEGEMSGRTEGGGRERDLHPVAALSGPAVLPP